MLENPTDPPDSIPEPPPHIEGATTVWNTSWRYVYDHFSAAIKAYARRMGLNDHSAEDVLQEVMTTLVRCQHGQEAGFDRRKGSFQAWLWGVIRNRVRAIRRKDEKVEISSPLMDEEFPGTGHRRLADVPQSLDLLPLDEDWRQALLAAAMKRMQEQVKPQSFAIYLALLEESADVAQLAVTYAMKPNAIYAVKHRCENLVLQEASLLRKTWEKLGETTLS